MAISMTDEDIIRRLPSLVGGNVTGPSFRKTPSGKDAKPIWIWQLTKSDQVIELASKIIPFLGNRRAAQLRTMIEDTQWAVLPTIEERFWKKVEKVDDCLLWTGSVHSVYGFGTFTIEKGSIRKQAHRYAYELHHGVCPSRLTNYCGDKTCVNHEHWGPFVHCSAIDEV